MKQRLALILGWSGGIYGIVRGFVLMSQPLYSQASATFSPEQGLVQTGPEPVPVDPAGAAVGILIISLIFIAALALLTTQRQKAFTAYAGVLFALSLLSLPSFGWLFLPATSLLLAAAILLWLPSPPRENAGGE